jgi:hypothetical protein
MSLGGGKSVLAQPTLGGGSGPVIQPEKHDNEKGHNLDSRDTSQEIKDEINGLLSFISNKTLLADVRASLQDHPSPSIPNTSKSRSEIRYRESETGAIPQNKTSSTRDCKSTKRPATVGEWDFKLPSVVLQDSEFELSIDEGLTQEFSVRRLAYALQGGIRHGELQHYLSFLSESVAAQHMNAVVSGYPAIFYAVATNDEKVVQVVRVMEFLNYFLCHFGTRLTALP